ncbi:hypothetical protein GCM10012275_56510 [Longimycelium tulufanense]|uniref:Uncharacterized protein n=1 Tax=Longimycelium tulufanense TaxID=907463 RepID=A0A8J3FYT2_9PSEU|nr:hypothetical protein [Longimycelium tulufanense]GGM78586.1 hypothetical protein GCM10012275_56510 [Longimycelium tulufanense]
MELMTQPLSLVAEPRYVSATVHSEGLAYAVATVYAPTVADSVIELAVHESHMSAEEAERLAGVLALAAQTLRRRQVMATAVAELGR